MKKKKVPGRNRKNRAGSVILTVIAGFCVLVAFAAFYVLTVVLSGQDVSSCVPGMTGNTGIMKEIGSRSFPDTFALRAALGIPVPDVPTVSKKDIRVFDDTYAGESVWRARVEYDNGAVLDLVMPPFAASLLERDGLRMNSSADCDVCNLSAVLCEGDGENCLLFADENAAYVLYMHADSDELMQFAALMMVME